MNIHELNTKAITNPAYVALDDGSDTYKLDLNAKLSTMQSSISGAESDIATAQADITLLQTNMGQAQGAISSAQGEIEDLQSDLNLLSTQTAASIGNLQTEVDAVEDDVTDLKGDFDDFHEELDRGYIDASSYVQGSRGASGEISTASNRCTTNKKYYLSEGDTISAGNIDSGYKIAVAGVLNGTILYDSGWVTANHSYTVASGKSGYYFVNIAKTDNADFAPNNISTLDVRIVTLSLIATIQDEINEKVDIDGYKQVTVENSNYFSQNKNYYNEQDIVLNTYIVNTSGYQAAYNGWSSTGYIPIRNYSALSCVVGGSGGLYSEMTGVYGAFYDSNKVYVSGFIGKLSEQTIPTTAAFVRISQETRKFIEQSGQVKPFTMVICPSEWETLPTLVGDYIPYGFILNDGIDGINNAIEYNSIRSVPDYTISEINEVIPKIRNLQGGNTVSFAFLTDFHNGANSNIRASNHHAIQSLQSIEKQIPLDYVVFGGDYLSNNSSTTVSDCEEQLQDLMSYVNEVRTPNFVIRGNHDSNHFNTSAPFIATMFYRDTDKFYAKDNSIKMYSEELEKCIGYVDLDNIKVRLIFTNMTDVGDDPSGFGITWAQMDWFGHVALDFSDKTDRSDWGVIVFSHSYFEKSSITDGGLALAPQMHQMLLAFKAGTTYTYNAEHSYDYTVQGAMEVICSVVGHWHSDRSAVVDGIQVIATMQTAAGGDEQADDGNTYAKVWGTADETAYDIFTINRDSKTINATRFGVGVDRSWTY